MNDSYLTEDGQLRSEKVLFFKNWVFFQQFVQNLKSFVLLEADAKIGRQLTDVFC